MRKFLQSIAFLACVVIWAISFGCRPLGSPPSFELKEIAEYVQEGDAAFEARDYDRALYRYAKAERLLSELAKFEVNSPSKDIRILQRFYNINTYIVIRIKLSMIAKELDQQYAGASSVGQGQSENNK